MKNWCAEGESPEPALSKLEGVFLSGDPFLTRVCPEPDEGKGERGMAE
jgi:hypothetical protein